MKAFSKEGLVKYGMNTGYLFLEKVARAVVMLIVWAQVIRYLGPEHFGVLSFAASIVFIFSILSDVAAEIIIVRDLVNNETQKNEIMGTTFFINFLGAVVAMAMIGAISFFFVEDHFVRLIIFITSLQLIFKPFRNIDFYFQAKVLSKYSVLSQLFSLIIVAVLAIVFVKQQRSLIYFAHLINIELIVTAVFFVIFAHFLGNCISAWRLNSTLMKSILKDCWPLLLSGIANTISLRIDQIMIKEMLGVTELGYYSAVVRVSEMIYFLPMVITGSIFPAIVRVQQINQEIYKERLRLVFGMMFWLSVALSLGISFFSSWIVLSLYGPAFKPAISVLAIHTWTSVFIFLGVVRTRWAIIENLQYYIMIYSFLSAGINIILNFLLLPIFSIQGAAIANLISYSVLGVLGNLLSSKTREIFFIQLSSINIFPWVNRTMSSLLSRN